MAGLIAAWLISVDSARLPFSYALGDTESTNTYGALALASPGLPSLRDGLRLTGEIPRGIHSFISTPHVTLVSAAKTQPDDLESGVTIEFDLVHHVPAVHRLPGGPGAAEVVHPLLLAGVMDQIAEQVMLESAAMNGGDTGGVVFGANLGRIFVAALDEGIEIRTLTSVADLAEVDLGLEATARITTALEASLIVIAPERSVAIDNVDRSGWWLIDPATGRTRDELDTGKGGASFRVTGETGVRFGPLGESSFLDSLAAACAQFFRTFGFTLVCGVAGAIVLLGLAASGVGTAGGATADRNPAFFYGLAAAALASAAAAGGIAGPACL